MTNKFARTLLLAGVMAACLAGSNSGHAQGSASSSAAVAPAPGPSSAAEQKSAVEEELRFNVTDDPAAFERSYELARKAAARHDSKAFADLLIFPETFNVNGRPTRFASRAQFLRRYDALVTPSIVQALARSQIKDLIVNWQGAATSSGEIWFEVDAKGRFCLRAINNRYP